MKYQVFIDGAEGTTGLKIHHYFQGRQDVEILKLKEEKRKDMKHRLDMIESAHISFLCLPDEAAREIATLAPKEAKLIDTSTAHRTEEGWVYGLPELEMERREKIRESNRIAVPGCHATGMILLMKPLIDAGVISQDALLSATSLTGYSGGGKKMIAAYRSEARPATLESPGIYALSQEHKHLPEIMAMTGIRVPPVFLPVVGDYYSGMVVTIPLHVGAMDRKAGREDIEEILTARYQGEALVRVMKPPEETGLLYGSQLAGKNDLRIYVTGKDERMAVTAVYDNLGKGASGAAIQNMNILLGIEETYGLV